MTKAQERVCTLEHYDIVLVHELSKYDQAQARREAVRGRVNIYRLGLLLEAAQRVRDDVKDKLKSSSPDALADYQIALYKHFEHDFPPVKKVVKQLEARTCKIR